MQEESGLHGDVRGVPEQNPKESSIQQRLPGLRAEGGGEGRAAQEAPEGRGVSGPDARYTGAEAGGLSLPEPEEDGLAQYSMDQGQEGPKTAEEVIGALPVKAQRYLARTERGLVGRVGDALGVPRTAQRAYLYDIAGQISAEYLRDGRVSQETIDRMFDEAYKQGVEVDREYYDQNRELRDYLRETKLTISPEDSADIPDFNDFRKSNFGRLNISTKGGTNIDRVYRELAERWPEFFDERRELHPADQLKRIAEVAQSFHVVKRSLDGYYGDKAEDFRRGARHDFETALQNTMSDLRTVRRYAMERDGRSAGAEIPQTMEEVNGLWRQLKDARRSYEKAAARNLLTREDEVKVGQLLRGEDDLKNLDPKKYNVKGITEVYAAKEAYERIAKALRGWNQARRADLRAMADGFLETANDWKDKSEGILYSRETMERNIRDIVPDQDLADQINHTYFQPVHQAAAAANRMKNEYRRRVKELGLSTRETRDMREQGLVSEAHAVQLLGEAEDNIRVLEQSRGRMKARDGKTLDEWRAAVDKLWESNPELNREKIRKAVQAFRDIYDELFQQMNEARVRNGYEPVNYRRGYFPHFQPGNGDGIMALFGRALGIRTEVTALPTSINGLTHTFRPGIQWFGNAQERLGFNTAYDAVEGFDRYIEGVADVICQTDNIQQLRALAAQIRYRTTDDGIREQIDAVNANRSLPEEDRNNRIEKIYESGRFALGNFAVELEEYTNLLANKKSRADRNAEQALGRGIYNLTKAAAGRVAANMVAVNPASWLTNFIPLTQGGALLDRGMLLQGMWQTLKAYRTDDGMVDASAFLTNRRGSDPLVRTWTDRASAAMSRPMEYIDQFVADSLVRARYRQNLGQGMSETAAMEDADAWTAGVMADRSKGAMPTLFERRNPLTKIFTQFQLEVNNQLSYLFKDIPREAGKRGLAALAAALLKFVLGAWLFDEVYEYFIGRRPALDPLGILNDTVGDLTGWQLPNLVELGVGAVTGDMPSFETEKTGLTEAGKNLAGNVVEELPFIGSLLGGGRLPVSSALTDAGTLWSAATDEDWSTEKRLQEVRDEILEKAATYLALPFGGGQIKKIGEAVEAGVRGGSYRVNTQGEKQMEYPVYTDDFGALVQSMIMGALFGKTTLPTGRDWIENGFNTLSARQTAAYQALSEMDADQETVYNAILDWRDISGDDTITSYERGLQQRDLLRGLDLTDRQKLELYRGLAAENDSRPEKFQAMMNAGLSWNQVMDAYDQYAGIDQDDSLTGEEKATDFKRWVEKQPWSEGQKNTAMEQLTYWRMMPAGANDKVLAAEEYGVDPEAWDTLKEELAKINDNESVSQSEAKQALKAMTGLTDEQRAVLWQMQNKSWNPRNNPFDRSVGKEIHALLNQEDEEEDEVPGLSLPEPED